MFFEIVGFVFFLLSIVGVGAIFFIFAKAVVEECAFNKESNELWKKYYAQHSLSK